MKQKYTKIGKYSRYDRSTGFSLVEMLVSIAVFSILMVVVFSVLTTVTNIYQRNRGITTSFQSARAAFETIKNHVTQATLQTYWDYEFPDDDPGAAPLRYARYSDLHFLMGDANQVLSKGTAGVTTPGDAIFFQLPGGRTDDPTLEGQLDNLLNVAGFYVEYGDGGEYEPDFIRSGSASKAGRDRYRLIQVLQPAERNDIYTSTSAQGYDVGWVNSLRLGSNASGRKDKHVLADNIVGLYFRAKSGPDFVEKSTSSAVGFDPVFEYNSRAWERGTIAGGVSVEITRNQLPPIVEVIMVAVDESSMQRLELTGEDASPSGLGMDKLFRRADAKSVDRDLEKMTEIFDEKGIQYRVFRSDILLQNALWSEEEIAIVQ